MKVGVALGGGGARGFAHIGVLEVLEQHGLKPDVVCGTSIGALTGAVYAAGKLADLKTMCLSIRLADVPRLLSPAWSTKGFFSGDNALEMLMELVKVEKVEQLPCAFAAVSVDLESSKSVVFREGNLRNALRASMSIPGLFTPLDLDNQVLVDGALLDPVPVRVCRELGADFVIAVDLFGQTLRSGIESELESARSIWPSGISNALSYTRNLLGFVGPNANRTLKKTEGQSDTCEKSRYHLMEVVESTLAVVQRAITQARLAENPPDILIQPSVSHVGLLDFHRAKPVIELGVEAGQEVVAKLPKEVLSTGK